MSVQYYLSCITCKEDLSVAEENYKGRWLKPSAKTKLPHFVIKHLGHELKILDEFDKINKVEANNE